MRRHRVLAIAAGAFWCTAASSWAQGEGRFLTGPLGWTPTIAIRDVGIDTNILDSHDMPQEDRIATVAGNLDSQLTLAHFKLAAASAGEYKYFQRTIEERTYGARFTARAEVPTPRIAPFGTIAYDRSRERSAPEIDIRARRRGRTFGAGASVFVTTQGSIQVSARREETRFDSGQIDRGADLAERLNRDSDSAGLALRLSITPLTAVIVDAGLTRDRFTLSPDQNTSNLQWAASLDFAPDAVIRGRIGIGYHLMEPRGPAALAFRGYTANVDLTYVFLDRTRVNGRYFRDTSYSIEAPYYLLTSYAMDIQQLIGGPFDVVLRANRQLSDYPENAALRIAHRVDLLDTLAAGVGVRLSETARVTVIYELTRRQSPTDILQYDRRRVLTSLTYGF